MVTEKTTGPCPDPTQTSLSDETARELTVVLKALSDPVRLRIFHHIASSRGSSVCACHMPEVFGVTQPTLSHHLRKLLEAGLIAREMRGKWAHFTPLSPKLGEVVQVLADLAPHEPGPTITRPVVLFICVRNSGKSQLSAALARRHLGDGALIVSAGTAPGDELNQEAARSAAELGATFNGEFPKPIDPEVLRRADRVIIVGDQATVEPVDGMKARIETWQVTEPSLRGIEGEERMRMIRDELDDYALRLAIDLTGQPADHLGQYRHIEQTLTRKYGDVLSADQVRIAMGRAHAAMASGRKPAAQLPGLVASFAAEQLLAKAQADRLRVKVLPELLFICQRNDARSQIAAALAKHLSGGRVSARSAGPRPSDEVRPLVLQVLAEKGAPAPDAYPKPITQEVIAAADVIVTMECAGVCQPQANQLHEEWAIADPAGDDLPAMRATADDIQLRITSLLESVLNNGQLPLIP